MAVIAIDFDHTLVHRDQMIPGAKDAINLLRERGHKVVIHTCNNVSWAEKVLNNLDIRFDYIWGQDGPTGSKLVADIYVDDRGYHFQGDWPKEVLAILTRLEKEKV